MDKETHRHIHITTKAITVKHWKSITCWKRHECIQSHCLQSRRAWFIMTEYISHVQNLAPHTLEEMSALFVNHACKHNPNTDCIHIAHKHTARAHSLSIFVSKNALCQEFRLKFSWNHAVVAVVWRWREQTHGIKCIERYREEKKTRKITITTLNYNRFIYESKNRYAKIWKTYTPK